MNHTEAVQLCRVVKALCPSQAMDTHTPEAWALVLSQVTYADAKQAVAELAALPLEPGRARYIEPGHIIAGIRRIRQQRIEQTPMPEPPSGLDAAGYLGWLRATRAAVADGTPQQDTTALPARPELVAQIRAIATAHDTSERTTP